jgi:hypothetical protein
LPTHQDAITRQREKDPMMQIRATHPTDPDLPMPPLPGRPGQVPDPDLVPDPMPMPGPDPDPDAIPVQDPELPRPGEIVPPVRA